MGLHRRRRPQDAHRDEELGLSAAAARLLRTVEYLLDHVSDASREDQERHAAGLASGCKRRVAVPQRQALVASPAPPGPSSRDLPCAALY